METQEPGQGKNRNVIIGVVVAIVLCCCCMVTGIAAYFGYQAYTAAQAVQETIQDLEIPTLPYDPSNPIQPEIPIPGIPGLGGGELPEGGRTDEITRTTAWTSLLFMGPIFECTAPTVDGTTIEVVQEPDASGVWKERWNIACGDGTSKPFNITFTPEGGVTNVNIEPPQ